MRYKIKVSTDAGFRKVQDKLRATNVQVFVTNEKRHTISTGNIPSQVLNDIKKWGAMVTSDQQYALE